MTGNSVLNRRFVRLQAVQHLYAFYVCKQADYDLALDQICNAFIPDVFADPPEDKAQLAQEAQQALALFASSFVSPSCPLSTMASSSSRVSTVVTQTLASYDNAVAKDMRRLEGGLTAAVVSINQACVRIWQLLVEWAHIEKTQTERLKLTQQHAIISSVCLAHNPMLLHLQDNGMLAKLVHQKAAGWGNHTALVTSWYNQFVKKDPAVQHYLAYPMTPVQDQQLLVFLIEGIIFREETIQAFFGDSDIHWATHKRIVRKLVRQGLSHFIQDSTQGAISSMPSLITHAASEQCFYTTLVQKTLQSDEKLEALIAEKAQKWSADRIMLLDKTIIKLALCEMIHFPNIPIKVSINEYIDLAKIYSMPKSGQFVNGLLDAIAATFHQKSSTKV